VAEWAAADLAVAEVPPGVDLVVAGVGPGVDWAAVVVVDRRVALAVVAVAVDLVAVEEALADLEVDSVAAAAVVSEVAEEVAAIKARKTRNYDLSRLRFFSFVPSFPPSLSSPFFPTGSFCL
jgi:hypothetical protein